MTTTYEIYTNDGGTPKAVTGNAPAIVERVENLETSVETLEETLDNGVVTSVNGNTGNITPEQTGCLPLSGGTMTGGLNMGNQQITNVDSVEFVTTSGANHGGYIDFHFNGSPSDFTSRIIEGSSGALQINATNGVTVNSKNIVRSVNGTNADASGNVTLETGSYPSLITSFSFGSESATSRTYVTKTITGLVVGRPVYLVARVSSFSYPSTGKTKYYSTTASIISGAFSTATLNGSISSSSAQFSIGFTLSKNSTDSGGTVDYCIPLAHSYTVFPCATSMSVSFGQWHPLTVEVWQ